MMKNAHLILRVNRYKVFEWKGQETDIEKGVALLIHKIYGFEIDMKDIGWLRKVF